MKSYLKAGCVAWLAFASGPVLALGLGNLRVNSLQGAPLEAEVDILATLDEMEQTWTVEVLEDQGGPAALTPDLLANLDGSVQRTSDGSLFVRLRGTESLPGPEISFRLRVASGDEARIARMSGTLLPLPTAPPMAQRAAAPPKPSSPPAGRLPVGPTSLAGAALEQTTPTPVPEKPAVSGPTPAAEVAEAQPAALATADTGGPSGQAAAESAALPAKVDLAAETATSPAVQAEPAPAQAAPPVAAAPSSPPVAAQPTPTAVSDEALPVGDWLGFSTIQALAVAAGLAVLVVLLVMRRRLATLVLSRFPALRDETLKAQVASKMEALAARQAQAESARGSSQPAAPAPRPEADLNAEIDVLLAYAEYAKAEEKLQAALLESPNNVLARLRLAELRYLTEDSAGFVALVEEIQAHHRGELSDEQWQKLTRMGKIVAPDAVVFAGPRVVQREAS